MRARRVSAGVGSVLLALVFAGPLVALVVQAFADSWRAPDLVPSDLGLRGFRDAFGGGGAAGALVTSLQVALATTAAALLLAWPAARVIGEQRLRRPMPVLLLLGAPLLVPPLATGTGLTEWFIRLRLIDTLPGLVMAHLTVVLPYVVLILAGGFGPGLARAEEMAGTLGMSPPRRVVHVTLPMLRPVVATAALMGFLVSWSQYGTSLAVGGGRPTLPIVLLPYVGSDPEVAAAFSLLFLAPAVAALVLAVRATRRAGALRAAAPGRA